MRKQKPKRKPGPEPETLKIEGNWKDPMPKLISKKRPEGGWPKPESRKRHDKLAVTIVSYFAPNCAIWLA